MPDNAVKLQESFNTAIEKTWAAWTVPSELKKWFGSDPKGKVLMAELDLRVGGRYEISFEDSDGTRHTCFGYYKSIKEPIAISFSWEWKSEPGFTSDVEISLLDNHSETIMQFVHNNLNPDSLHGYAQGWKSTFEKLRAIL